MKANSRQVYAFCVGGLMLVSGPSASARIIFESAPATENVCACGSIANDVFYFAANFQITETVETGSIGGRLSNFTEGEPIFGAIVRIDGEFDWITPADFEGQALLGATLVDLPATTQEVSANLRVTLTPGWYALVFGAGRFGAIGAADVVANETMEGASRVYTMRTDTGLITIQAIAARLYVDTVPIPEFLLLVDTMTSGFNSLRDPALDAGEITFRADDDIFRMALDDEVPTPVARRGDTMPGSNESFNLLSPTPTIRDGSVALYGQSSNGLVGIYTDARGALERVIDTTMTVPGGIDLFQLSPFSRQASISGKTVTFPGRGGTTSMGIFAWRDGLLEVIASDSTLIPGTAVPFGVFDDLVVPVDGHDVGFVGGNFDSGIIGVYVDNGSALEMVYDNSVLLPDGTPMDLAGGLRMREGSFTFVACTEGQVACGFYSDASGELETVASLTTPIPGGTGTFLGFALPHAFDGRHVVLTATLGAGRSGVFTDLPGELVPVVVSDDSVAGRIVRRASASPDAIDGNKIALWARFDDVDFSEALVLARYPAVPGDVNDNGFVDLLDAAQLQNCFGETVLLTETTACRGADFNGDTKIAADDFARWIDCQNGPAQPSPCRY